MGSPLGPTLANFFLAHFENKFMSENLEFLPEKYVRYVDDVFCVFGSMESVGNFLEYLNHLHPNLKFTHELGPRKLAFLDTEIDLDLNSSNFGPQVYRKPTNTKVILNWTAYCPKNWKLGLISCLINRAYIVCSTWDLFNNEMGKLKDIFKKNGYPNGIFDRCLNKFLERKFNEKRGEKVEDENEYVVLVAPYFGHVSDNLKKKMCKIGKDLNVKTRVVFKSFKIGQYFSLKDVTPKEIKANVIYKFTGSCDKSITYIGKTIRHLAIRSKEHLENNSAIFDHIKTCQNCQNSDIENFQILSTGNSDKDIRIKEALLIKRHKPCLNNQLTHKGMSYFLHLF